MTLNYTSTMEEFTKEFKGINIGIRNRLIAILRRHGARVIIPIMNVTPKYTNRCVSGWIESAVKLKASGWQQAATGGPAPDSIAEDEGKAAGRYQENMTGSIISITLINGVNYAETVAWGNFKWEPELDSILLSKQPEFEKEILDAAIASWEKK